MTYNRAGNTLALPTDAGAPPSGTIAPGSSSQQNSQCTLTGSASSITVSGNVLTLNLAIGSPADLPERRTCTAAR